jgi:hypothetical protein
VAIQNILELLPRPSETEESKTFNQQETRNTYGEINIDSDWLENLNT